MSDLLQGKTGVHLKERASAQRVPRLRSSLSNRAWSWRRRHALPLPSGRRLPMLRRFRQFSGFHAVTDHAPAAPIAAPTDDFAAAFQIEGWPVRGRLVRLGEAIDKVLSAHAYPEAVAALLGEACVLAAIVGSALKFDGRLIVQAQGDGPVRYVVA